MFSKMGFEIQACTRCGGSGEYSYCESYGTKCFKCSGKKICFTAKGAAASAFYNESLKVPLGTLAIGDLIRIEHFTLGVAYFAPITEIGISDSKRLMPDGTWESIGLAVTTEHPKHGQSGYHASADTMVRKGWDAATKAEKLAAAIAYQGTLTKAGTVKKSAMKGAA